MRLFELLTGEERLEGGEAGVDILRIISDSRSVGPRSLFAALPGTKVDGASFVPGALGAGAAAILAGEGAALPDGIDVPVVRSADPRRSLARMVARLHGPQPGIAVAVTGTNGKTSVAAFTSQLWAALGRRSASIGTLGVTCEGPDGPVAPPPGVPDVRLTSPDPVTLHRALQGLAAGGIGHVAVEASSHGLEQRRLDGVEFAGGAFTNITRDHLDYHPGFEAYLAAKTRLFRVLLPEGGLAVVNLDGEGGAAVMEAAEARGLRLLTHGRGAGDVRLAAVVPRPRGLDIAIEAEGRRHDVALGLVGGFQAENALTALCLATAAGIPLAEIIAVLPRLRGARGRLEPAGVTRGGGAAFVDYAHTPDALRTALKALRPHVAGRIVTVFGAGGDRDRGKRPLMGEAVAAFSDVAIVTDDNPRSEDPAAIRAEVRGGCPDAAEIGDRAEAIAAGLAMLAGGDALLVAGKGHETGQEIAGRVHHFSDHEVIAEALGRSADE